MDIIKAERVRKKKKEYLVSFLERNDLPLIFKSEEHNTKWERESGREKEERENWERDT